MSSEEADCVLCCREIRYYATGPCEHHVCYECSTRMRVLCEQNECPICRREMPSVVFTHKKKQYFPGLSRFNEKYTIAFEDAKLEEAFKELLRNQCQTCGEAFKTFDELKAHSRNVHTMYYCELCVKNLRIFTFERKCYSRKDLAYHNRKGDLDDKSHRGHPLCEFCDDRFIDSDELYRHLRREHYFCHFCDADGIQNGIFYGDYSFLQVHFRKHHYLCEEDDCANEQFIGVFRTEIDFKAHFASKHLKNKSRAEAKQARTLGLEFPIKPRSAINGHLSPNHNEYRRNKQNPQTSYQKRNEDIRDVQNEAQELQKITFNTECVQDFPSLANGIVNHSSSIHPNWALTSDTTSTSIQNRFRDVRNSARAEDFPALSAPSNPRPASATTRAKSYQQQKDMDCTPYAKKLGLERTQPVKTKANNSSWGLTRNTEKDFPKLETKKNPIFKSAYVPPEPQTNNKPVIENLSSNSQLAEEIYKKCKSKKKQKSGTNENRSNTFTMDDDPKSELSRLYTGFSKNIELQRDESKDPLRNLNLNTISKIDRFKSEDFEEYPWQEKANLVEDDFPPLGPPVTAPKAPPGFQPPVKNPTLPPPGFGTKSQKTYSSLSTIAQRLTKTNSSALEEEKNYQYEKPYDFDKRNGMLIDRIFQLVESNNQLFEEFKIFSGNYRKDRISAAEYHSNCMRIIGKEKFPQLFTELLCLLPDIKKQQELLAVHSNYLNQNSKNKGAVPKHKGLKINPLLTVCQLCQQVLTKSDYNSHAEYHKELEEPNHANDY